jgi:aflatoxin B1 aldehyde reductase
MDTTTILPILGTMNINYLYSSLNSNNTDENRKNNKNDMYKSIIERYLLNCGKKAILDTAYYYGNTSTEKILGEILEDISETLAVQPKIATKVNPWYENDFTNGKLGQLSKEGILHQLNTSLTNLKVDNVEILYLHCPDYETPIGETLETCDMLWRREKFNYLGLSNFSLAQTKEIINLIEKNSYDVPLSYYQGMYNLISRKVEEIFPLLRENEIEFWAYNPLAGGLLTGKYRDFKNSSEIVEDSRFKNNSIYQSIFWKPEIIENKKIQDFFQLGYDDGNQKCIEYSFKWLQKYSKMSGGDKIVVGCSNVEQLTTSMDILQNKMVCRCNCHCGDNFLEKKYFDDLYKDIAEFTPNYWY